MTLRTLVQRTRRIPTQLRRWTSIARARPAAAGVRVYYGRDRVPGRGELAHGGTVKFQSLAETFPNSPRDFNLLYLGSGTLPADARMLARLARRRGVPLVWNQNGVAYAGWHGPGWERVNEQPARLLHEADHVLYQSEFCKLSADRFYGECDGAWEVLHNPVDTERFMPAERRPRQPTLLLAGNQYQRYRYESALGTLKLLDDEWRLLVTGRISWHPDHRRARSEAAELLERSGLGSRVELTGPYTQSEAPELMLRADLLLHTKYNDPCPTAVLEAMACGLPVVYSASGGVAELVGPDAGIGIDASLDWERDHPPQPELLRDAVLEAIRRRGELGEAARRRAVELFDVRPWIERHRALFEELVR